MKCPTCPDDRLVMTERSGIEIDYCPTCRGVWLDRGELDKIIERSVPRHSAAPPPPVAYAPPPDDRDVRQAVRHDRDRGFDGEPFAGGFDDDHDETRYDDRDGGRRRPKKRRESLLSELFDF
jgi:Zn-finger nucleic acid-binding protein